jgi:hypothetical protein
MKHPTFKFDFNKVTNHSNNLPTTIEQINYLEYVLKEYKNLLDDEGILGDRHLEEDLKKYFIPKTQREIDYKKKLLNRNPEPTTNNKPQKEVEKICWQGSEPQIIYLFDLLYEARLLSPSAYDKRFALIAQHFLNKDSKPFKREQLAQAAHKMINNKPKEKDAEVIEKISKEVKAALPGKPSLPKK